MELELPSWTPVRLSSLPCRAAVSTVTEPACWDGCGFLYAWFPPTGSPELRVGVAHMLTALDIQVPPSCGFLSSPQEADR